MAYKLVEDQKAASRRHYGLHKVRYLKRNRLHLAAMRKLLDTIKASTPCADCGVKYPAYVMDFDHTGTDKIAPVSRLVSHSEKQIRAEIAKCEVVCSNCHRERTHSRLHRLTDRPLAFEAKSEGANPSGGTK